MLLWSMVVGCGGSDEPAPVADPCDDRGDEQLFVVQSLYFQRGADGISDGFDLDGAVGGEVGCFVADWTAPDGTPGVDNAFASVLPLLELTEAAAVEGLIQTAIASGELLLTFDLAEVDDPADDACVDLTIGRALGPPILGTDGLVLSGQTFDPDLAQPSLSLPDLAQVDGVMRAPVDLAVPITIFGVALQFELQDGQLEVERQPDGTLIGKFAGGVDIGYILEVTETENVDSGLHDIVESLLSLYGDLTPDETGACTRISMGFSFLAVPAFWYP